MTKRMKVLFIFLIFFPPIFLGILIWLSPQFQSLELNIRILSYIISVGMLEFILLFLFLYIKKRIPKNFSSQNEKMVHNYNKINWWVYILLFIGVSSFIYYLFSYQYSLYDVVSLIVPVIIGPYFLIKNPISKSGVFSRKFEYILGQMILIIGVLRILAEIFM